jgi:hypothetical protein
LQYWLCHSQYLSQREEISLSSPLSRHCQILICQFHRGWPSNRKASLGQCGQRRCSTKKENILRQQLWVARAEPCVCNCHRTRLSHKRGSRSGHLMTLFAI